MTTTTTKKQRLVIESDKQAQVAGEFGPFRPLVFVGKRDLEAATDPKPKKRGGKKPDPKPAKLAHCVTVDGTRATIGTETVKILAKGIALDSLPADCGLVQLVLANNAAIAIKKDPAKREEIFREYGLGVDGLPLKKQKQTASDIDDDDDDASALDVADDDDE